MVTKRTLEVMRWTIWALAALFYLYEFFLRVTPSMIVPQLMSSFHINAAAVGTLSAFYYYIYAPMQLPVGLLTDRYGARRLLSFAAILTGIGALFFGIAEGFFLAAVGRFLMGFGASFGFVGMIYICSHWFDEKRRGILIGMGNSIGMLGAVLGQGPLGASIRIFGWRFPLVALAIIGVLLGLFIYLLVRNDPPGVKNHRREPPENVWKSLSIVSRNKLSWINAVMSLFFYVTTSTFASLWGVSFLQDTYQFSSEKAGFLISLIFLGWAIGGPFIGLFSDRIQQKKSILLAATFLCSLLMSVLIYAPSLPITLLCALLLSIGILSSAQLLTYSYSIDINPNFAKGTAAAFTNLIVILGAVVMQPLVGFLLDRGWSGEVANGVRIYAASDYRLAMSCFPLSFLLSFILGLFLRRIPR